MPRAWPRLSLREVRSCLKALGFMIERNESSHEIWAHPETTQQCVVDTSWDTFGGPEMKHIVAEQLKMKKEAFYGATRATKKKLT